MRSFSRRKAAGQVPAVQRPREVQGAGLSFQQCEIMDRIVLGMLPAPMAPVPDGVELLATVRDGVPRIDKHGRSMLSAVID